MSHTRSSTKSTTFKQPSIERIKNLDAHPLYFDLKKQLCNQNNTQKSTTGVLHWFRNKDLRIEDNTALYYAAQKAKNTDTPLITVYLYCPRSLISQGISKARLDFILETLSLMQSQLHKLNIPLVILSIDQLSHTTETLTAFLKKHDISDLYANYEYETDELQRDIQLIKAIQKEINCAYYNDQCAIEPGSLLNQQKKPLQVYTHYHKKWVQQIYKNKAIIETRPKPQKQSENFRQALNTLFNFKLPSPPPEKKFNSLEERNTLRKLWPAGNAAALKRLNKFIKEDLESYGDTRSQPALASSARISPYLAIGAISVRTILTKLKQYNNGKHDFSLATASQGLFAWVREIVFREFYRQQLVITPHVSMNIPQNPKFSRVKWEVDEAGWKKWCDGKTGVPWIDAGMRQLQKEAYMHNRLRMNVSAYLYHTLLIDYHRGERYFAEMLIDLDLSNNAQGWSPSYTVFNPILQAEKNDAEGNYIRKWVPELRSVKGKAIFDPYHRLSPEEFKKLNYPKPHSDWEASKHRARARFKEATQGKF